MSLRLTRPVPPAKVRPACVRALGGVLACGARGGPVGVTGDRRAGEGGAETATPAPPKRQQVAEGEEGAKAGGSPAAAEAYGDDGAAAGGGGEEDGYGEEGLGSDGGDHPPVSFVVTADSAKVVLVMKSMISNVAAGSVIGKGGEIVAAIRSMSQCKVSLTESNPALPERVVRAPHHHPALPRLCHRHCPAVIPLVLCHPCADHFHGHARSDHGRLLHRV